MVRKSIRLGLAFLAALGASPASAQVRFEEAIRQLSSPDTNVRLRTVQILNAGAYPEAAIPLAPLIADPDDDVQLEAIAAELNIFLAQKIVSKRRVALVVEVRDSTTTASMFAQGPGVLNAVPIPVEVVNALRTAARDKNPRVATDALYTFGLLATEIGAEWRPELLRVSAAELAGLVGASDLNVRFAAIQVIGRVFAARQGDAPVEQVLGDAVTVALNDRQRPIREAAFDAVGSMRYERSVQALIDLVRYYHRNDIGMAALAALARIAHPSASELFVAELSAGNRITRITAVEGLARLGDRAQAQAIRSALARERNEAVTLAQQFAAVLLEDAPLDPLLGALGEPALRDQALRYLIELAPGRTAAFKAPAQHGDPHRRADVAFILATAGDDAALPIVQPMRRDVDAGVVRAADRAVVRLQRRP